MSFEGRAQFCGGLVMLFVVMGQISSIKVPSNRKPAGDHLVGNLITILYCVLYQYRQSRPIILSYMYIFIYIYIYIHIYVHDPRVILDHLLRAPPESTLACLLSHPLQRSVSLEIQSDLVLPLPQRGADRGPDVIFRCHWFLEDPPEFEAENQRL